MRGTSGTKATRNMKDFLKSFMTKKKKYIYIYIYTHNSTETTNKLHANQIIIGQTCSPTDLEESFSNHNVAAYKTVNTYYLNKSHNLLNRSCN